MATAFGMHGILFFALKRIATKPTAPSLFSLGRLDVFLSFVYPNKFPRKLMNKFGNGSKTIFCKLVLDCYKKEKISFKYWLQKAYECLFLYWARNTEIYTLLYFRVCRNQVTISRSLLFINKYLAKYACGVNESFPI